MRHGLEWYYDRMWLAGVWVLGHQATIIFFKLWRGSWINTWKTKYHIQKICQLPFDDLDFSINSSINHHTFQIRLLRNSGFTSVKRGPNYYCFFAAWFGFFRAPGFFEFRKQAYLYFATFFGVQGMISILLIQASSIPSKITVIISAPRSPLKRWLQSAQPSLTSRKAHIELKE